MFLRNEIKPKSEGYTLKHYCEECGSTDIRFVCNRCGSNRIEFPSINDDSRYCPGYVENFKNVEYKIYKCDKCGKEFSTTVKDDLNYISLDDGTFRPGLYNECYNTYHLKKDLCYECLCNLTDNLNKQLDKIYEEGNVLRTLENL